MRRMFGVVQELVVVEDFELGCQWELIVVDADSQVVYTDFSFPSKADNINALPMAINLQVGYPAWKSMTPFYNDVDY